MSLPAHIKGWVTLRKLLIHVIEMASVRDTCKRDVRVAGNQHTVHCIFMQCMVMAYYFYLTERFLTPAYDSIG